MLHHDRPALEMQWVAYAHLNPASRYPHIFLDAANHLTDSSLTLYALDAGVYACARMVEAYGLWLGRGWAKWLAALSGSFYVPVEIFELCEHDLAGPGRTAGQPSDRRHHAAIGSPAHRACSRQRLTTHSVHPDNDRRQFIVRWDATRSSCAWIGGRWRGDDRS